MGRGNSLLVAFRENQTKGNLEFPAGRKTLKNLLFQSGLFAEGLFFGAVDGMQTTMAG
jgi:hypothetical protein